MDTNGDLKNLLIKDLAARLPYGVKIHIDSPKYGKLIGTLDAPYIQQRKGLL